MITERKWAMKKQFSKKIALLLAITLCLGTTSCGKKEEPKSENPENKVQNVESTEKAEAPETQALQTAFMQANNAPTITAGTAILIEQQEQFYLIKIQKIKCTLPV